MKLHNMILLAMLVGLGVGLLLWWVREDAARAGLDEPAYSVYTLWWLNLLGATLFMGALKMIIAPLIFASIVAGVTSLPRVAELGAIGWKTVVYYATTTSIAVTLGLAAVLIVAPGLKPASQTHVRAPREAELAERRAQFEQQRGRPAVDEDGRPGTEYLAWLDAVSSGEAGREEVFAQLTHARERTSGDIFKEDILLPLLMNPFASLSASPPNALGIIFFALLLGVACSFVGPAARPVVDFFQAASGVMLRITHWLMSISPVAIGCIMAELVAKTGPMVFQSLGWYCSTVVGGIAVHVVLLVTIARVIGGIGPRALWAGLREAYLIAFTTRSSAATLPVTIANVTEKLKVSPKVANFTLPLGATMNMDGTALYEGVAVIFLIQVFGGLDDVLIDMTPMTTFLIFITAVIASIGAAAVPNAGLVTMVIVASAVGLPIYYIPLILAVDAVLDMFRTSTNVLGDAVGAVVVHRLERGRLDGGQG